MSDKGRWSDSGRLKIDLSSFFQSEKKDSNKVVSCSCQEIDHTTHQGKKGEIGKIHIFFGFQMITDIIKLIFPIAVNRESVQLSIT